MSNQNPTPSRISLPNLHANCPANGIRYDADGEITTVGSSLELLYPGLFTPGRLVTQAIDVALKMGIIGANAARSICEASSAAGQKCVFETSDGRSVLLSTRPSNATEVLLTFTDVTYVVNATLSQQRDLLTGLPNRAEILRILAEQFACLSATRSTALLHLDLDRFKAVNDTLGHPIGDALLKLVAERLQRVVGPEGLVARLGGDEFVVVQTQRDQPQDTDVLASRIIEMVGRTYLIQGHSVQIGVSVGVALAGFDGSTPEELIRSADLALYKAKSGGRSTYRFYTEAMNDEMQERRALETDLRRALVLGEFSLVYQPQFQIEDKKLVGFEALVRWSTPERGPVSPAQFIPLAEETGLIKQLGEWVLRTACTQAVHWPDAISVSVNLSPVQVSDPKIVAVIVSALAQSGLPAHRLDLEITEGSLMQDTDAVLQTLQQIKNMGIKVSMDDFGTGYSSLSYLRKFPFDKIKIDQSFIRGLETDPESAAIVRAVIALGDSLGMMTVAEGVETETQLLHIAKDGCKQVQGYLTGRPLSSHETADLVAHL